MNKSYEKKRSVCSTDSSHYSFFAPITSFLWREKMDYYPLIFSCGKLNNRDLYALDFAKDLGAEVWHIPSINGYSDQTIAQVSRIFAACLPVSPDTYILTSDMDMWPLSKSYFHQQDDNKKVHLFGGNVSNHLRYPMCYIGMNASEWREIMGIDLNKSIESNIESKLDTNLGKNPSSDDGWYFDEKYFTANLKKSNLYYSAHLIDRKIINGGMEGRVDRGNWKYDGLNSSLIDSHVLRPGYYDDNWARISRILYDLLKKEEMVVFENYRQKYINIQ